MFVEQTLILLKFEVHSDDGLECPVLPTDHNQLTTLGQNNSNLLEFESPDSSQKYDGVTRLMP
jgi:hypothetical protein